MVYEKAEDENTQKEDNKVIYVLFDLWEYTIFNAEGWKRHLPTHEVISFQDI